MGGEVQVMLSSFADFILQKALLWMDGCDRVDQMRSDEIMNEKIDTKTYVSYSYSVVH